MPRRRKKKKKKKYTHIYGNTEMYLNIAKLRN
jgi:hypothetical protein